MLPPCDWEREELLSLRELKEKSEQIKRRKTRAAAAAQKGNFFLYGSQLKVSSIMCNFLLGISIYQIIFILCYVFYYLVVTVPSTMSDKNNDKDKDNPLKRTKKPWGGLVNDIKRRLPFYKSDFLQGLNMQCFASAIFIYFAALSAAITFGGLMGKQPNLTILTMYIV